MKWEMYEPGWYWYCRDDGRSVAAVCLEGKEFGFRWCTYLKKDMPPGDSQHKTLREAKAEVERRYHRRKK